MNQIYDCCIFFNELDMLELRLRTLDSVVDYFVICEAAQTHSGQPKPYHLEAAIETGCFDDWADKMIYIQIADLAGPGRNSWERERYHRSCIADGLLGVQRNDWVIVGDCDEIAAPHVVGELRRLHAWEANCVKLELDFYYYDLNHRVQQGWAIGARRWQPGLDPNDIRTCAGGAEITAYSAGWHLSWFGGPQQMIAKHDAFMHHADANIRDLPHDPVYLTSKIEAGQDIFNRDGFMIDEVEISQTLPRYVLDNPDKYRAMGWVR